MVKKRDNGAMLMRKRGTVLVAAKQTRQHKIRRPGWARSSRKYVSIHRGVFLFYGDYLWHNRANVQKLHTK